LSRREDAHIHYGYGALIEQHGNWGAGMNHAMNTASVSTLLNAAGGTG
jgi:hypothetical protein